MRFKKMASLMFMTLAVNSYAESIKSIVEFFSFKCSHCKTVSTRLEVFMRDNKIKYLDINVDNTEASLPTNIMYYVAIDSGIGFKFKNAYFNAVANGMPVYTPSTLNYVINQIKTPRFMQLINSKVEQEHIKQKLSYVNQLLSAYYIEVTPTFLINQNVLLEGEDFIYSFN